MSYVMLKYHRAGSFLPPREGTYLVWVGRIPRLAFWNNRSWIALEDIEKVNPPGVTGITYWAFIPTFKALEESDPTGEEDDGEEEEATNDQEK